jgi:hypothetical protein
MSKKTPRDPIAKFQRDAIAERRIGKGKQCACGEARPRALIPGSQPLICEACNRERLGKLLTDDHHVAGRNNSPVTIPVPVNDHRARLSDDQNECPTRTLKNPDGSPLLAAAGCIRGFFDTILYLIEKLLVWVPELLEALDAYMVREHGPRWWISAGLEQFATK